MSDSLQLHGLHPIRLLCPWDFPGKNTEVGCHFLFQGIFWPRDQTHVSCGSWIAGGFLCCWAIREARILYIQSCLLLLSSLFDITLCCYCCSVTKSCLNLWTSWPAAHQAPLSSTTPWHLLKFMCTESVMLSNHLILSLPSCFVFSLSQHHFKFHYSFITKQVPSALSLHKQHC